VLHIEELTYSLIAAPDSENWCATQAISYRTISQAVAQALAEEGFGVSLDRGYPVEKPQALRAMTPCFSSTARSEVVSGGRKVVGSAQRRLRGAFLQHGSILISRAHRNLVDCLNLDPEKNARATWKSWIGTRYPWKKPLGRPIGWAELADGFEERFANALGVECRESGLTGIEEKRANELIEEKARHAERLIGITSGVGRRASGAKS